MGMKRIMVIIMQAYGARFVRSIMQNKIFLRYISFEYLTRKQTYFCQANHSFPVEA